MYQQQAADRPKLAPHHDQSIDDLRHGGQGLALDVHDVRIDLAGLWPRKVDRANFYNLYKQQGAKVRLQASFQDLVFWRHLAQNLVTIGNFYTSATYVAYHSLEALTIIQHFCKSMRNQDSTQPIRRNLFLCKFYLLSS